MTNMPPIVHPDYHTYTWSKLELDAIHAYAREYAAQVAVSYVLVPLEPTQAMIKAGRHALSEWLDDLAPLRERMYEDPFKSAWKEAIAAAHEPNP